MPAPGIGVDTTRPLNRTSVPRKEARNLEAARTFTLRVLEDATLPYARRTAREGRVPDNVNE